MKKITIALSILIFASACLAMGSTPKPKMETGDKDMNEALMEVQQRSRTENGAREIEREMQELCAVTPAQLKFMREHKYNHAEMYFISLLARYSGKTVNQVVALHGKGMGWGLLAQRLRVYPSDLNKLRVRLKKAVKPMTKEQTHTSPAPKGLRGKGKK